MAPDVLDRVTLVGVGVAGDELGYAPRFVTFRIEGRDTMYRWVSYGTDQYTEQKIQHPVERAFGKTWEDEPASLAELLDTNEDDEDDEEPTLTEVFNDWMGEVVSEFDGRLNTAADHIAESVVEESNERRPYIQEGPQ